MGANKNFTREGSLVWNGIRKGFMKMWWLSEPSNRVEFLLAPWRQFHKNRDDECYGPFLCP